MAYCIMDKGGTGDCAYRSAAAAIADKQSKEIPDDNLIQEGSRLRLLDVSHLTTDKAEPSQDLALTLGFSRRERCPDGTARRVGSSKPYKALVLATVLHDG